ncbi:MAG: GNAT family N-acetyltransferase [Caulobacterales bacterium]|uniref:GNAT family N-acetyltransferase n=1 Tax=Glycocaulis sp. TaxID=1969725 RepID=UPI003FA16AAE
MLRCETIRADALSAQDHAAWVQMAQATGLASPLLHPDFAQTVAQARNDVEIALFRDCSGLAAVFAYHRRPGGFARPIGSAFSDVHAILRRGDVFARDEELLSMAGLSRARFSALFTPDKPPAAGLEPVGPSRAALKRSTADALLSELQGEHPKRFKDFRRRLRKLETEIGEVRLERCTDRETLDQLIAWKRIQYRETGRHDVLAPRWTARMMHALFDKPGPVTGRLYTLRAGGRLLAAEYGPEGHGTFHPWLAAYDPSLSVYSPGHLLVYLLLSRMDELGLTRYEMGTGHEDYKKYFTNHRSELFSGLARAPHLEERVREAATQLMNAILALGGERVRSFGERIHSRIDHIAAAETSAAGRWAGLTRAAGMLFAGQRSS